MRGASMLVVSLVIAAGCSEDRMPGGDAGTVPTDSGPPTDTGGGGGTDTGPPGTDAGQPPAGSLVFEGDFDGSLWLAGTVTMPISSTDNQMQINVVADPDEGFGGNHLGLLGSTSGETVDYAITGLRDGLYQVQLRVDTNGNGMVGDSGDWEGWYAETVAAPVTDQAGAAQVTVRGAPVTGVDFALGVLP